jgi:hypothetical protein
MGDQFLDPSTAEAQSSIAVLVDSFANYTTFSINAADSAAGIPGLLVGRYLYDSYNGGVSLRFFASSLLRFFASSLLRFFASSLLRFFASLCLRFVVSFSLLVFVVVGLVVDRALALLCEGAAPTTSPDVRLLHCL